jgi:hypothetical protein
MNKPPEKIFIGKTRIVLGELQGGIWIANREKEDDIEYNLAPDTETHALAREKLAKVLGYSEELDDTMLMLNAKTRIERLKEQTVWHDAVKEPPKKDGKYNVINSAGWEGTAFYFVISGWDNKYEYPIVWWIDLPPKPERSGE